MLITDVERITCFNRTFKSCADEQSYLGPTNPPCISNGTEVTRDPGSLRVLASPSPLLPPLRFAFQLSHQQINLLCAATVNSSSRHNSGKPRRADTPCNTAVMVLILFAVPSATHPHSCVFTCFN